MHAHVHAHVHGHHHHAPPVSADNERRVTLVFLLTAGYALVQFIGGWLSGSLALMADSGHMVSDAAALLLALLAYRLARRAPDPGRSFGLHRVRVLAALANGASLLVLVVWIVWEAIQRFNSPAPVLAAPMLVVAVLGLLVNLVGAWVLSGGNRGDGNLRGALLHVVGDLLGSVGAILAAIGIMLTGWTPLDPILSVLVSLIVVRSAWSLVADATRVLLQATPRGLDPVSAQAGLCRLPGIASTGHFHAWTLADDSIVATVHVTPTPDADPLQLPGRVAQQLRAQHGIGHVTVQVDPPDQAAPSCTGVQALSPDATCKSAHHR